MIKRWSSSAADRSIAVPRAVRGAAQEPWPRPRKRLGQHFLTDVHILTRIADALAPTDVDTVVEIGPGRGALTALLTQRAGRVVAVELDRELAARLQTAYEDDPRVTVLQRDVLEGSLADLAGTTDFLVAGNVPYYITTPILFHALRAPRARRGVYLVQREVAERVVAAPGTAAYGALSVNVQALAKAIIVCGVAAGAFHPPPKVESAVLRIEPRPDPVIGDDAQAAYSAFVIAAFGLRRKQMRRVLRTLFALSAADADRMLIRAAIDPEARPEVLSAHDFAKLLAVRHSLFANGQELTAGPQANSE
jgi:16S rRNA (adenine1518-N6/adenine1519-N6)-dimethyltransferase